MLYVYIYIHTTNTFTVYIYIVIQSYAYMTVMCTDLCPWLSWQGPTEIFLKSSEYSNLLPKRLSNPWANKQLPPSNPQHPTGVPLVSGLNYLSSEMFTLWKSYMKCMFGQNIINGEILALPMLLDKSFSFLKLKIGLSGGWFPRYKPSSMIVYGGWLAIEVRT